MSKLAITLGFRAALFATACGLCALPAFAQRAAEPAELTPNEARFAADLRAAIAQPGGVLLFVPHPEVSAAVSAGVAPAGADDCALTTSLTARARAQARRLGAVLQGAVPAVSALRAVPRADHVVVANLCSARETARLVFIDYDRWDALDQTDGAPGELRAAELAGYLRAQFDLLQAADATGRKGGMVALVAAPQHLHAAAAKFGVELPLGEVVAVASRNGRLSALLRWQWDDVTAQPAATAPAKRPSGKRIKR